jgi:hypothetical protein
MMQTLAHVLFATTDLGSVQKKPASQTEPSFLIRAAVAMRYEKKATEGEAI